MGNGMKRRVAGILLGLGLLTVVFGFGLYQSAKNDADRANRVNVLVGARNESVDMTWPLVCWIGGGFAVLCSVILYAGSQSEEADR